MNMKKRYVKPDMEVLEIENEILMMAMSSEQSNVGTGNGPAGDETPDLSNKRRGTWGNLWEDFGY